MQERQFGIQYRRAIQFSDSQGGLVSVEVCLAHDQMKFCFLLARSRQLLEHSFVQVFLPGFHGGNVHQVQIHNVIGLLCP